MEGNVLDYTLLTDLNWHLNLCSLQNFASWCWTLDSETNLKNFHTHHWLYHLHKQYVYSDISTNNATSIHLAKLYQSLATSLNILTNFQFSQKLNTAKHRNWHSTVNFLMFLWHCYSSFAQPLSTEKFNERHQLKQSHIPKLLIKNAMNFQNVKLKKLNTNNF